MNDARCSELLPAYLEGSLPAAERAAVDAHLSTSAACRDELARLRLLETWLDDLPREVPVPSEVTQAILASTTMAASTEDESPTAIPLRPPRRLVWTTAAAVLITAVLAWWLSRPGSTDGATPVVVERDDAPDRTVVVAARLVVGDTVGRAPTGARVRIYAPSLARLYHDLTLMKVEPAMSFNNVRIARETPFREVEVDADGRIGLDRPLARGRHLAFVEVPGHVGTWGLLDAVETAPRLALALVPAHEVRVHGTVRDRVSGQPVAGAIIATPDGTGTGATDADGQFDFVARVQRGVRPRFCVLADGFVPLQRQLGIERDRLDWDARIAAAERRDVAVALTDAAGEPLRGAIVLLAPVYPIPGEAEAREVGVTDDTGRVVFRSLVNAAHRMTVSHPRAYVRDHAIDADATEIALRVPPDGDARCTICVQGIPDDERERTRAILTYFDDRTRLIERHLDLEGCVRFAHLRGAQPTVQLFTGEGLGYYITFPLDDGDATTLDYPLPPRLHTVRGRLAGRGAESVAIVRIQGDLPRLTVGRRKSLRHRFAVETIVRPDGTFEWPALPRLRNVEVIGRATDDHRSRRRLFAGTEIDLTATTPQTISLGN